MKEFIAKFGDRILGVLSLFDLLSLRGMLRAIVAQGMEAYLEQNQVLLKTLPSMWPR